MVLLAVLGGLGLAGCGGGGSSEASSTTVAHTAARRAGNTHTLASYLQCLGQHGVDVKKAASSKGSGGAGEALKKDPHYKAAAPACKHLLS